MFCQKCFVRTFLKEGSDTSKNFPEKPKKN